MKLPSKRLLDELLNDEEPCLGAVFCTFSFDPEFFEEQVLRTLLRLRSDPQEHASMFHEEARRALQECPVAVLVDARVRRAGRRLPYDQLLVRRRTFHPKLVLALYAEHARVAIGSANLTRGGYDENLELVTVRSLHYGEPAHAAELREIDRFIAGCGELAVAPGTQLQSVRDELARRLGPFDAHDAPRDHALLSSLERPILDQLFARLPEDAAITRIGVLAPFYERDDEQVVRNDGMGTLLRALLDRRPARGVVVDLAGGWDDAPVTAEPGVTASLEAGLGRLWAWRRVEERGGERCERVSYLVPTALKDKTVAYLGSDGSSRREDRTVIETAVAERRMWPVRRPQLHLPSRTIEHLRGSYELRLWMQPAAQLDERGRVQRRPLHAKLFLITTERGGHEETYVLVGSPNASRAAMLWSLADGANVELAVLTCVEHGATLVDLLPTLVRADVGQVELVEREMPASEPDLGAWIRDVVHGPRARDLVVHWADDGPAPLGPWRLSYEGRELASGSGVPAAPTCIESFDLLPSSAELELRCRENSYAVPIRVSDLAELPTNAALAQLDLRELLALLGRRIGADRLAIVRKERGAAGAESVLDAILGSGFGPIDVFKAWWGIAHELAQPISVPAFRHRLCGPTGVAIIWERLRAEVERGLSPDEVWIYGCELLLALRRVVLPDGADGDAKRALLAEVNASLESSIRALQPPGAGRPWLGAVVRFYREGLDA